MYKIAIVGLGSAGIFTLALLPPDIQKQTIVFEPSAIGGDLATQYSAVVANIPNSVIIEALRSIPAWSTEPFKELEKYKSEDCPLLLDVVRALRKSIAPALSLVAFHSAHVAAFQQIESGHWRLITSHGEYTAAKLVLCTGATPKVLDFPKPVIPLHAALSSALLPNYVTKEDTVVVFGTAHSGTLALKNLHSVGVSNLTGLYKGSVPFRYARDGFSEGIKQESAVIADSIVAEKWATLVSLDDFASAYRAVHAASAIVYAIGFERPRPTYTDMSGALRTLVHNGTEFHGVQNIYGFGIGFPAPYTSDGHIYPDVGFGGFIGAIKATLPSMLTFAS